MEHERILKESSSISVSITNDMANDFMPHIISLPNTGILQCDLDNEILKCRVLH